MPVIPARKLKQEDWEFGASLSYSEILSQEKNPHLKFDSPNK
jgi:hypothetical protein